MDPALAEPRRKAASPGQSCRYSATAIERDGRGRAVGPLPSAFLRRESLRGNTIGATALRASERKSASERVSQRVSEREGFQRFLRGFERF